MPEKNWEEDFKKTMMDAYNCMEAADHMKREFIERMSKDIRVPMNTIIGNASIAKAFIADTEKIEECLDTIMDATKEMYSFVGKLLEMNRFEGQFHGLYKQNFSVKKMVKNIVQDFEKEAEQHDLMLLVNTNKVKHDNLYGDVGRIRNVVRNVLENAVLYTKDGGRISLDVSYENNMLTFLVEDNGVGMSQEFLRVIFQPFEREDNARARLTSGAGVGLMNVKNSLTLMNGTIDIKSKENMGTTVTIRIPVQVEKEDIAETGEEQLLNKEKYSGKKLLYVSDEIKMMNEENIIWENMGFSVTRCINGPDAIRKIESQPGFFDFILIENNMKNMNGFQTATAIRCMEKEKHAKIIGITDNMKLYENLLGEQAGMNAILVKPISKSKIYQLLNSLDN